MNKAVTALVLCAGESSRMGSPKALLPWGNTCVLGHILEQVEAAGIHRIIVVTGAHDKAIRAISPKVASVCHTNPDWRSGMGSSIRTGVIAARQQFEALEGYLILLGDQPLLRPSYIKKMLLAFTEDPGGIVASKYPEGAGVPALFPDAYSGALLELSDSGGARALLRSDATRIRLQPPSDSGRDMDTPEAYQKLLETWNKRQQKNDP